MIKNYIWDFDGMLFDSYPHITSAFQKMMSEYGKEVNPITAKKLFEKKFSVAYDFYDVTQEQKKKFREYEHDVNLKPIAIPFKNTVKVLEELNKNGKKNYVYTHRGKSVFYYLEKYNLLNLFDEVITSQNAFPEKPSPAAINYLTDKYGLNNDETVMIGDREIDVLSGNNAGVLSCRYSRKPINTVADFLITDIAEVLKL